MLRLNKKTEYALLALRFMSRQEEATLPRASRERGDAGEEPSERQVSGTAELASAKAIAAWYSIPEMLLAKVLQVLKRAELVAATKGSGGGYRLSRPLEQIPLLTVLDLFNEHVQLVDCLGDDHEACQQAAQCDIRGPLDVLNRAIMTPLSRMSVADLFTEESPRPRALSIFR